MRKIFDNGLFLFILCGIIFTSVGIGATTYFYKSSEILYDPSDTSWEVNSVEDALNSLHDNYSNIVSNLVKADGNKIPSGVKKAYVFSETLTSYNYQSLFLLQIQELL